LPTSLNHLRGRLCQFSIIMETIKNETLARPQALASLHINILAVLTLTSGTAFANTADNIVVTANRTATPVASLLAQATIITREDLDAAGAISLVELLQRRAGVEIRATGGPGQPSSVFIRGANATHTLVLVDGLRLGSSTSGSAAFENIALDTIERIEVVKGPRSGLYGADAIGGVIQIFTRRTDKATGEVNVGVGTDSTRRLSAALNAVAGDTTISVAAGYQRIDAPSATNALAGSFTFNPDRDAYQNRNGKIGVLHRFTANDRLSFDLWQSQGKVRFDAGSSPLDTFNAQRLSGVALQSENQLSADWFSQFRLGQTVDDISITSSFPSKFKTSQNQLSWQNDVKFGTALMTVGIEQREEKVASTTNYTAKARKTNSLFLSATEKFDTFLFAANIRSDRESQFGQRTTGGASIGWQVSAAQLLYVSAANAFRAPSFNDLYFPGFSNPLLSPEKSRSSELGWRMTLPNLRANVALFDNQIENLIAFDFVTSKPQNVQRARIRGLEMTLETVALGIDWRAQLTAQTPKNAQTDKQLRSRAKTFAAVSASQTLGAITWRVDIAANGARFDSANEAASSRMSGYTLVNASLNYRLNRQIQIELSGNNLADRTYELARGYNQLQRQWLINVRMMM
jgi:vitamin B12 transporter